MAKQTPVCVAGEHLGGDAGVTTAGYVEGVYVGLVLERYDQIAHLDLINAFDRLLCYPDLLHHRRC